MSLKRLGILQNPLSHGFLTFQIPLTNPFKHGLTTFQHPFTKDLKQVGTLQNPFKKGFKKDRSPLTAVNFIEMFVTLQRCRKTKALEFLGWSIWETKIIKLLVG